MTRRRTVPQLVEFDYKRFHADVLQALQKQGATNLSKLAQEINVPRDAFYTISKGLGVRTAVVIAIAARVDLDPSCYLRFPPDPGPTDVVMRKMVTPAPPSTETC